METLLYDLPEFAHELEASVEQMIRHGAYGELVLCVVADKWPGKRVDNSDAKSDVIADGLVELLPADLLKSMSSETTEVRQVKTADGDVIELDSPQKVRRGVHFVRAAERDRVQEALKPEPKTAVAASADALSPYLDPEHHWYSETLEAAVSAWMTLYANGGFKKKSLGHKVQIESWLKKHRPRIKTDYARKGIARVVNPDKKGGNPRGKKILTYPSFLPVSSVS